MRCLSMAMMLSITTLVGLRPSVALATGATRLAIVPSRSVLASMVSRRLARLPSLALMRARWMMSAMCTPLGHATSQRLQLRHSLSILS